MPTGYDEIRTALARGFSVTSLRDLVKLCLESLQNDDSAHPAVLLAISTMAQWIADAWDEKPILTTTVNRVEQQLRPHFENLVTVDEADSDQVCTALDDAARAFAAALRATLDS